MCQENKKIVMQFMQHRQLGVAMPIILLQTRDKNSS